MAPANSGHEPCDFPRKFCVAARLEGLKVTRPADRGAPLTYTVAVLPESVTATCAHEPLARAVVSTTSSPEPLDVWIANRIVPSTDEGVSHIVEPEPLPKSKIRCSAEPPSHRTQVANVASLTELVSVAGSVANVFEPLNASAWPCAAVGPVV